MTTGTTTNGRNDALTSADSGKPTGEPTPADALGESKRMSQSGDGTIQSGGEPPTDEKLLSELRSLADALGRSPTAKQVRECGEYPVHVYRSRFGSWNGAKEAAGLDENPQQRQVPTNTDGELLSALRELGAELDRSPTSTEMDRRGEYTAKTYQDRFGSWNTALERAGLEVNKERGVPESVLLAALTSLADDLNCVPTGADMEGAGGYSRATYTRRFGSWNAALERAGFDLNKASPGDGVDVVYGEGWTKAKRAAVRERDGYECQACGMSQDTHRQQHGQALDVHHIIPAREFDVGERRNDKSNLVTLCRNCHHKWEGIPLRPELTD